MPPKVVFTSVHPKIQSAKEAVQQTVLTAITTSRKLTLKPSFYDPTV